MSVSQALNEAFEAIYFNKLMGLHSVSLLSCFPWQWLHEMEDHTACSVKQIAWDR